MADKRSIPKQDSPTEMIKRIFAVASLIVKTDGYQETDHSDEKLRTKTQK